MAKTKTLEERLWGAAILKVSTQLRGQLDSPWFRGVFPGVLRDLALDEKAVDEYIAQHREKIEKAARGTIGDSGNPE